MVTQPADLKQQDFIDPPWSSALDASEVAQRAPAGAQISGMFIAPLVAEIKRLGLTQVAVRERYVSFQFYPLCEHIQLLAATCPLLFPNRSLREGLRKLGRAAPIAFVSSTLGRVVFGSATGVQDCVDAFAKGYELNMRPGSAQVLERAPRRCIVRMSEIYSYLDSHHIGAFEGVLKHAGARGRVRICARATSDADLLLEWE
jgi:uncharacterized protein (TIGR02265 family)